MDSTWIRTIGIAAVIGGLYLMGSGLVVTPANAAPPAKETPQGTVTQNWDRIIAGSARFTVLGSFNNLAVRDNETGLVWEQSPEVQRRSSLDARFTCAHRKLSGRKGWRLPSVAELSSLVDANVAAPGPTLPAGHPFSDIQMDGYWSSTSNADDLTTAWDVDFSNGNVNLNSKTLASGFFAWCVRGPMNADAY